MKPVTVSQGSGVGRGLPVGVEPAQVSSVLAATMELSKGRERLQGRAWQLMRACSDLSLPWFPTTVMRGMLRLGQQHLECYPLWQVWPQRSWISSRLLGATFTCTVCSIQSQDLDFLYWRRISHVSKAGETTTVGTHLNRSLCNKSFSKMTGGPQLTEKHNLSPKCEITGKLHNKVALQILSHRQTEHHLLRPS